MTSTIAITSGAASRHRKPWRAGKAAALAALTLLAGCAEKPPLQLVTEEEAAQPATRNAVIEKSEGPAINVRQPALTGTAVAPFPIQIDFTEGSSGLPVNMDSLKLTYLKMFGIDITDRVREYISGTQINVPEVDMPEGEHRFEIYIEDVGENVSVVSINVDVLEGGKQ